MSLDAAAVRDARAGTTGQRDGRTRTGSRSRRGLWLGVWLAVAAIYLLAAVFPQLLAPGDPLAVNPADAFSPPVPAHPLGTDESGRGVYTRIVHGASSSLTIGALATVIGLLLGAVLGLAAGLGPRWLDFGTTRIVEVFFAFPGILLALLLITLAGPGLVTTTIAVGLSTAPGYARLIRSQVLRVRASAYMEADLVLGRSRWHSFTRTLLPNVAWPLFSLATLGLGQAIVWAAALSYLGLGEPPPSPEWGSMLSAGRLYLPTGSWWLTIFPGTAIVGAAVTATMLGRIMQQRTRQAG
ncbi:ABC transporter permease [Pseudoclavibacter sp. VKM Ac-2888]|uniref:ABC transporter permease n=1 Tax=Pseudoclavibacter sp. VKM Ac-2888 TaxID=2783830 RepID=UPI00188B674F|nr:ABC transporter permease [Pseudoclavibacter sp. VKM Ac-2888]MBF4551917.1 ABC transporter permease [Pseudoclavibacter sp. VKM Ac-2888]